MLIGYARVSTPDQNINLQKDALLKARCEKIFEDIASGSKTERKGLTAAIAECRKGDTLVIWKLDRMSRSTRQLIETIEKLKAKGVFLKCIQDDLDTSTPIGNVVYTVFAALAEFERDIIKERTHAGLAAARARGKKGGRPKVMDKKQLAMAKALYADKTNTVQSICQTLNIHRSTFYKYIKGDACL
jgi:DNA invertase Pin-like site-specific DNA recombinase